MSRADESICPAVYACHPSESRGRLHREPESATRSCFQRDRDRIIHSGAFRRLKHKTQVFVYHEGDYYRTRLTHSIEVAQIARTICRGLGLNEDLTEALALAHDLGHTCFGHAGEGALHRAMANYGGFDHNEQTFRLVTELERRYADFDGLNLTWECLEGLAKHNGPLTGPRAGPKSRHKPVPATIARFLAEMDLEIEDFPSAEAQVAALSDDIAYSNHDIDDGLRAGLFEIEELVDLPLAGPQIREIDACYPQLDRARRIHELVRRLIGVMVGDLTAETTRRLAEERPDSVAELRALGRPVVAFSDEVAAGLEGLRDFLFRRMYRHEKVQEMIVQAKEGVSALFAHYLAQPDQLPDGWRLPAGAQGEAGQSRLIADYIAGMTDRYALLEFERIFNRRITH